MIRDRHDGGFVHGEAHVCGPGDVDSRAGKDAIADKMRDHWDAGCVVLWSFDAEVDPKPRFPLTRPWYGYREHGEFYLVLNFWHEMQVRELYADDGRGFYIELSMDNLFPEEGETPAFWEPSLRLALQRQLQCELIDMVSTT